ncbi:ABC transporter ATP-binding protein [Cohnella pontilimi]|uniref:Carnitine transport ATP-binding protein OpuCA n=2 Tax=Cohnella pontilimi TaxID=2564100 RepID=A0A4U0F9S4_9BACL|nr:ABC transporter ATP-binding protein [Cohnella pontilimi]
MIQFENVSKQYKNSQNPAVKNLSVGILPGEFITILGGSGSGKTTVLKMINRIIEPSGGTIFFKGQDIMTLEPDKLRREIGYVIQQSGLFPHMTVEDNIALLPDCLKQDRKKTRERVRELLRLVRLEPGQYKDRYPRQLSGGQQQRVSIARALVADPDVMLMDEPFGAIDALIRIELQEELKDIHKQFGKTILFVTHDVHEAMRLGTRVMVMKEGVLQQFDTPANVLLNKENQYVADIVGNRGEIQRLLMLNARDLAKPYAPGDQGPQIEIDAEMEQAFDLFMSDKNVDKIILVENAKPVLTLSRDDILIKR